MILKSIKFMALISFFSFNFTVALKFPKFNSIEEAEQQYEKLAKEYWDFVHEVNKIGSKKDKEISKKDKKIESLEAVMDKLQKSFRQTKANTSENNEDDQLMEQERIDAQELLIATQNKMIEGLREDKKRDRRDIEDLKKNAGGGKTGIAKNTLIIAGAFVFLFFFTFMSWHLIVRDWVVTDPEIPEDPLFSEEEIAGLAN